MATQQRLTPSTFQSYATAMCSASRQAVAEQLVAWCKEMVVSLRVLAVRLDELAPADACDIVRWFQPQVDHSLAESDRILEAIDAET